MSGVRVTAAPVRSRRGLRRAIRRTRRGNGERGYIAVVTALLLPLLLLMAAFAIDAGLFYYRANQLQRVADAAALAGVTHMPQFPSAEATARQVIARNGISDDPEHDIVVEALDTRKIRVTIRDRKIPTFFGQVVRDRFQAERKATAEYLSQIPLGSTLNAIGTGNLPPSGSEGQQNFWLSASGFCSAKEDGDQILSRYEGSRKSPYYVAATQQIAEVKKYACPLYTTPADIRDPGAPTDAQVTAAKVAVGSTDADMPELVLNRDYDRRGYNYIVNVPCSTGLPPPCELNDFLPSNLRIEIYDPVFDPGLVTDANYNDPASTPPHPDIRLLYRQVTCSSGGPLKDCPPANKVVNLDNSDSRLANVKVTTEFRAYGSDQSPLNYDDDGTATASNPVTHLVDAVRPITDTTTPTEAFGTCNGYIGDDARCTTSMGQWVRLIEFPSTQFRRGRFRINVRTTANEANSMGQNSFSLRAYYAADTTYAPCTSLTGTSYSSANCPNISGDTSMATNASATSSGPAEFYLAKLTPAKSFRNKTIQVLLWDPGEGGQSIQILAPNPPGGSNTNDYYAPTAFTWKLNNPGINQATAADRTTLNGQAQTEPNAAACNVGANAPTYTYNGSIQLLTGEYLDISGGPSPEVTSGGVSCLPYTLPNRAGSVAASTPGGAARTGRFNGRLVNIVIKIPTTYGLDTNGAELTSLPFDGWWKIKYYPTLDTTKSPVVPGLVSDRATWTVQLVGDPVHLVRG